MNIQLTLAVRYLSGRKLRTFLTTLAVMFGVLVLFAMNIVMPSMLAALQASAMAGEGNVDLSLTHVSGEPFDSAALDRAGKNGENININYLAPWHGAGAQRLN